MFLGCFSVIWISWSVKSFKSYMTYKIYKSYMIYMTYKTYKIYKIYKIYRTYLTLYPRARAYRIFIPPTSVEASPNGPQFWRTDDVILI